MMSAKKKLLLAVMISASIYGRLANADSDHCLGKPVFALETATTMESTDLLAMIAPYQQSKRDGIKYFCGQFHGYPVVLVNTGIGKVYAAAATASLIHHYHPSFILFTGIAGKLTKQLKYGEIVVGEEVYQVEHYQESKQRANGLNPNSSLPYDAIIKLDDKIIQFAKSLPFPAPFAVSYGRIATTDVYPETKLLMKQILASDSSAVAMEDYAVITTCQLFHTNCLTVRAISDNPQKILYMRNSDAYHVGAGERTPTAQNLAQYVKVFLDKWISTAPKAS